MDYIKNFGKVVVEMVGWLFVGKMKSCEYVVEGFD